MNQHEGQRISSERKSSQPKPESTDHGVIIPDRLYTFAAFEQLNGTGRAGMRAARAQGLPVRYFGRQGYVLGADIINHIMTFGRKER